MSVLTILKSSHFSHVNLTTGVVYSPALEKNVVVLNNTKIVVFDPSADRNDPSNEEGRGSWDVETLLETCCAASLQGWPLSQFYSSLFNI